MLKRPFWLGIVIMVVAFDSQNYVVVEIKGRTAEVRNDKPFLLYLSMKPIGGIHINVEPPISVKQLDDMTALNVKKVPKSGEYLDSSKPIEVECKVKGVGAGPHKLRFVVDYTYCSDKEGWCRMGKDTVSATVRVKK